jgi:hypothetical protein
MFMCFSKYSSVINLMYSKHLVYPIINICWPYSGTFLQCPALVDWVGPALVDWVEHGPSLEV